MPRPRRRRHYGPPREIAIDITRETAIGAGARRNFRRRVAAGCLGLALLVLAALTYRALRPGDQRLSSGDYPVLTRCSACQAESRALVSSEQRFPIPCAQCGQSRVSPMWACLQCDTLFLIESAADEARCPSCASLRVGSAVGGQNKPSPSVDPS